MALSVRTVAWGALLALAAAVGLALWDLPHGGVAAPAGTSTAAVRPGGTVVLALDKAPTRTDAGTTLAPAAPAAPAAADTPPPGLHPAQWASLRQELANDPAELRRLATYFAYADALRRLRDGSAQLLPAERRALAQTLDQGLDERLQRQELSAGEARMVKLAVLQVLLDTDAARQDALARWLAAQPAAAADGARRDRESEFLRRQAALVAAWQARPAAARDPRRCPRNFASRSERTPAARTTASWHPTPSCARWSCRKSPSHPRHPRQPSHPGRPHRWPSMRRTARITGRRG